MAESAEPAPVEPGPAKEEGRADPELEVGTETGAGPEAGMVHSSSWWGVSSLTSYLANPHLLEAGMASVASSVAQVGSAGKPFKITSALCRQGTKRVARHSLAVLSFILTTTRFYLVFTGFA